LTSLITGGQRHGLELPETVQANLGAPRLLDRRNQSFLGRKGTLEDASLSAWFGRRSHAKPDQA
jgi:hypothetical protein